MASDDLESTLPEIEQWLLNCFISRFLPKSNNRRKYSHNEFSFIHGIISGIFFKYRKVNITASDLMHCFALAGYSMYVREKPVNHSHQKNNPHQKNKMTGSIEDLDCFIYIGVSSAGIMNLKKAVNSIAYQKNCEKIIFLAALKKEINDFFAWNHTASP